MFSYQLLLMLAMASFQTTFAGSADATNKKIKVFVGLNSAVPGILRNVTVNVKRCSSALDALKAAAKKDKCFEYKVTNSTQGTHIEAICNLEQNVTASMYWNMYVGNKLACVNVDEYKLMGEDVITFKYEKVSGGPQEQMNVPMDLQAAEPFINQSVIINITHCSTAYAALGEASKKNTCFEYRAKQYKFGPYIEAICNVEENKTTHMFWMFYVNNKEACVGVGDYKLMKGDDVSFVYKKVIWSTGDENNADSSSDQLRGNFIFSLLYQVILGFYYAGWIL